MNNILCKKIKKFLQEKLFMFRYENNDGNAAIFFVLKQFYNGSIIWICYDS